jgi:hypothetical protein
VDYLINKFIKYCYEDQTITDLGILNHLLGTNKQYSFLINNIKIILGACLKNGLAISFYNKIYGIYTSDIKEQNLCYNYQSNKYNINLLWKNINYVFKFKHSIKRVDLLVYSFLFNIKYSRKSSNKKLITNLYKVENLEYNKIIDIIDKYPKYCSLEDLYDRMNEKTGIRYSKLNSKLLEKTILENIIISI